MLQRARFKSCQCWIYDRKCIYNVWLDFYFGCFALSFIRTSFIFKQCVCFNQILCAFLPSGLSLLFIFLKHISGMTDNSNTVYYWGVYSMKCFRNIRFEISNVFTILKKLSICCMCTQLKEPFIRIFFFYKPIKLWICSSCLWSGTLIYCIALLF